jgi:hypothetical protein
MHTVAELYPLIRPQAGSAGSCSEEDLMERMNVIGPEILTKVEARGMITTWCLPICNGCVVLPSDLETPIQAWLNGESLGFRGAYWLGRIGGDIPRDMGQSYPWQELVDDSRSAYTQVYPVPATQNDVYEITARSQQDAGKEVQLRYRDSMGREILYVTTLAGDHTASNPSNTGIGDVTYVYKPRTVGALELWMRNLRSGHRFLVAVYDAVDEHPEYRLVHITGCANGKLVIKGRKKWMPLRTPTDVVPFGHAAMWRVALIAEAKLANRETAEFEMALDQAARLLENEMTAMRPRGTSEVVDHISPWTLWNKNPLRAR